MSTKSSIDEIFGFAVAAHKEGRFTDAENLYVEILTKVPEHDRALFNLAQLAVQFDKREIATHYFVKALSKDNGRQLYWETFLAWLIKMQDASSTLKYLVKARECKVCEETLNKVVNQINTEFLSYSDDPKYILSQLYNLGFYKHVYSLLADPELEGLPKSFAHNLIGACQFKLKNSEQAIDSFRRAVELDPEDPDIHYNLGCCYGNLKMWLAAENSYRRSLNIQKSARTYNNLGLALQALNKTFDAIESYECGIRLDDKYADLYNNLGTSLKIALKYDDAERSLKKAIRLKENFASAHNNLGTLYEVMERYDEAKEQFEIACRISPNFTKPILNIGNCANRSGDYGEAIEKFKLVLTIDPDNAEAYNNLGTVHKNLGEIGTAKKYFKKAIELSPALGRAYSNLAVLLKDEGETKGAIKILLQGLELSPGDALAWNNLGAIYKDADMIEKAEEALYKSVSLSPKLVPALYNLAGLLERSNALEKLEGLLSQIEEHFDEVPIDLRYYRAKLLFRKKDYSQCYSQLQSINLNQLEMQNRTGMLHLKGVCLEHLGDFDSSFLQFEKMNKLAKKIAKVQNSQPGGFMRQAEHKLSLLKRYASVKRSTSVTSEGIARVFLVGFPRSGTTLLDTVLRSHSKVTVIEEKPMVHLALQKLQEPAKYDFLDIVPTVEDLDNCRRAYKEEEKKHISMIEDKKVIINKLPLNIIQIPFILCLFPGAKFILAMRHPYDSMLSCWMQDFQLNASMANMTDLSTISRLYNICFNSFDQCKEKLGIEWHQVRYESLITDFKPEVNSLLKFLKLDWEDRLLSFRETAKVRGKINTPSYSQVVQPLYQDAKFRWKKYEKYVQEPFSKSRKWLIEFEYE